MKKILLQTIKLIALFGIGFGVVMYAKDNLMHLFNNRVDAAGALTFDIGVPNGQPIFTFNNFAPGDSETKIISAQNDDTVTRTAGVKGVKTTAGTLDAALMIEIKQGGTTLYGPVTLVEFFADSQTANGVELSQIAPGDSADYEFIVTFDSGVGNEYQNQTVQFDLLFGIVTDIPQACEGIKFANTLYGTAENNTLNGTNKNDLIIALEGNDKINSGVGNDCIIGGSGDDQVETGVGHDIVDAGDGDDRVRAGVGNDEVFGGIGADDLHGDAGNDVIFGSSGNDRMWGGVGSDILHGEADDDTLAGEVGNDLLLGGDGTDSANGAVGKDTCIAETKTACEL